jgi:hypothetical protein
LRDSIEEVRNELSSFSVKIDNLQEFENLNGFIHSLERVAVKEKKDKESLDSKKSKEVGILGRIKGWFVDRRVQKIRRLQEEELESKYFVLAGNIANTDSSLQEQVDALSEFIEEARKTDYTTLPLSYVASGMNQIALRSSWSTDAIWASFVSGPYTNYPGSGEQFFDQGSLAIVKGNTPFLVNATGALLRNKVRGVDDKEFEEQIYEDNFGSRKRSLYNIFYAGKGQVANSPNVSNNNAPITRLTQIEEHKEYVVFKGSNLEAMYPNNSVSKWNRQVVYIRPDMFVVFDETKIPNASTDSFLAFHLTNTPVEVVNPSNAGHRFVVKQNNSYVGSVTTLFPISNKTKLVNVFDSNKVYRLEVRPLTPTTDQTWLTVFDASGSENAVTAEQLQIKGSALGALLKTNQKNYSIAFSGQVGTLTKDTFSYTIPTKATTHIINDLPVGGYFVQIKNNGATSVVSILPGGTIQTSSNGRLYFSTNGEVVRTDSGVDPNPPPPVVTPPPTGGDIKDTMPVFHIWNAIKGDFYTVSTIERDILVQQGWQDKGIVYRGLAWCADDDVKGTVRVRRFDMPKQYRSIYSTSAKEQKLLLSPTYAKVWKDEGMVFCAYQRANVVAGVKPVYRLRHAQSSQYRYTMLENEKSELTSSGWVLEGISFYAFEP